MKRLTLLLLLSLTLIFSMSAQNKQKSNNLPRENSKVTREYDERGNLIRFDSTYTYSWSGDTAFAKSFSPRDFPDFFGNDFKFLQDSSEWGGSFFDDFGRFFAEPFRTTPDSSLIKRFNGKNNFNMFDLPNDSMFFSLKDFDKLFNGKDGTSGKPKFPDLQSHNQKSMSEMMKKLQKEFQDMEERQRKFFEKQPEWKEF